MHKAHLVSSNIPLIEHGTYFAVCGAKVEDSIFRFFFDEDFRSLSAALSRSRICRHCIAAQAYLDETYVYGIVSAQKLPESERTEEEVAA